MPKTIEIKIGLLKQQIATSIKTKGYDNNDISDQFELLGIMDNLRGIIQERIKKLMEVKKT